MIYPRRKHRVYKIPRPIVHRFRDRISPITEKWGKWKARYARAQKENEKNVASVGCRFPTASKTPELNPRWTRNAEAYLASLITAVFIVRETVPKRNRDVNAHWLVLFFFSPCFSLFFSFLPLPPWGGVARAIQIASFAAVANLQRLSPLAFAIIVSQWNLSRALSPRKF